MLQPQSNPAISNPLQFQPASRLRRLACMLYEGVLLFAVVFLAGYLFDTLTQSRSGLTLRHLRQFVLFAAIGLYFVISWRAGGQTLPMKTWNVFLLDASGQRPKLGRLIGRYFLLWPLPLLAGLLLKGASTLSGNGALDLLIVFAPFTLFIPSWFDPQKKFLHDRLLRTELVTLKPDMQTGNPKKARSALPGK